jgi:glycosyltransferase involved in cell wall biosynthesis
VVRLICQEYGGLVDFTFIGVDPGLKDYANVHYIPFIKPYEAYRKFVEDNRFAIGLAPGREDSFYACKYYNKFIEYASIGAAGIYTCAEPYTQVVIDGVNGLFCKNTADCWYNAIKRLMEDGKLRNYCAISAQMLLREKFNPNIVAKEIISQCPELYSYKAPLCKPHTIHLNNGFLLFYWERVRLLWRQHGLLSIPTIAYRTAKVLIKILLRR